MDEGQEFRDLISRLRDGDPSAAGELFRRYGRFVRAAVRRHLDSRLRSRFDSLDFVQDVWVSFLLLAPERLTFECLQALLGFLARVVQHKLATAFHRHVESEKEGVAHEVSIEGLEDGDDAGLLSPSDHPSEWLIAAERWERLLSRIPAGHRAVLERLREGYTYDEIAGATGVNARTIRRIVSRLREVAGL